METFNPLLALMQPVTRPDARSGPYETPLPPIQEMQYQMWRSKLPRGLQYEGDYDLRGAYLANFGHAIASDGLPHMGDQFKKPNHPSFSRESQYATSQAPFWYRNRLMDSLGNVLVDESQ